MIFILLFKLIPCPMHWMVCVSQFKFHTWILKQFFWIVWSTLYVYLCLGGACYHRFSAQYCGNTTTIKLKMFLNKSQIGNFQREKWKRMLFCNLVKSLCNTGKYAGHEQKRCAEICILFWLPRIKLRYLNYWTITVEDGRKITQNGLGEHKVITTEQQFLGVILSFFMHWRWPWLLRLFAVLL